MGVEPVPGAAPVLAHHDGPPDDVSLPPCRLQVRAREFADPTSPGAGGWHTREFADAGSRHAFVQLWQHDFEMSL